MLPGTKLGRYEIRQKIGSGGMGEVYLAHDDGLNRSVALKVLLPEFCADDDRVDRFRHEAKAASALNHPNIITIYEIGQDDDRLYIATEHVKGETLREMLAKGELTQLEAIGVAEQVADALAVAHEARIVHRDIKPENIMIRGDGIVKILDFGLAKPIFEGTIGAEDETVRLVDTQPGMVMGSVRYMSPEQARGKETDQRTDVWSLGVVLYEILTGKNPFEGETISDSLAAVIHVEPAPVEDVPEELQRILRKALKKNPEIRYQSIKDFALDLRDIRLESEHVSGENDLRRLTRTAGMRKHDTGENETRIHQTISSENKTEQHGGYWTSTQETTRQHKLFARPLIPAAIILSCVALAVGGWYVIPKLLDNGGSAFQTIQASRLTDNGNAHKAEISPDGRFAAFVNRQNGQQSLVVKQISTGTSMTVVAPSQMEFQQPAFTPDGEFIYYVWIDRGVGTLYQVSTLGGESKKIAVDVDSKVTFSPDGKRFAFIRHSTNTGGDTILIANQDGTGMEPFLQTKEAGYDQFTGIDWSPDGERIVVGAFKESGDPNLKLQLAMISLQDKTIRMLGDTGWYGAKTLEWLADGSGILLVGKSNTGENSQIWHVSYPSGEARQVTTDTSDYGSVSVSSDGGTIVATRVDAISSLWSINPQTREMQQLTPENKNLIGNAGIWQSALGQTLFSKITGRDVNIFSLDGSGGNEKQLTSNAGINVSVATTSDGRFILFSSNRGGSYALWRMNSDGSDPKQITAEPGVADSHPQSTKDGKMIVFSRQSTDGGKMRLMKVSMDGGQAEPLFPEARKSDVMPRISADGGKMAYHTFDYDEKAATFHSALRVVGIDGSNVVNTAREVEFDLDAMDYRWSPDGKSLAFIDKTASDNIWQIPMENGTQKPLTNFGSGNISGFNWAADGRRLLIVRAVFNSDLVLIKDGAKV